MTKIVDELGYPRYYSIDWYTWNQRADGGSWNYLVEASGKHPRILASGGADRGPSRLFRSEAALRRGGYQQVARPQDPRITRVV